MNDGIEAITTAALRTGLDAANLRQQAISANIANHGTQGYVPLKLDFQSQMLDARRTLDTTGRIDAFALSGVRLDLVPKLDANGAPAKVHLDEQMAEMSQNAVHYQTLARGLSRHLAILYTAASDGKR